ncbi:hypothetical protein B0H13DRAFT_1993453 [Mycena leptocephala]|nr:hypothetical protein B0H13DRAFT_1993453 [Mycena leptocephala]
MDIEKKSAEHSKTTQNKSVPLSGLLPIQPSSTNKLNIPKAEESALPIVIQAIPLDDQAPMNLDDENFIESKLIRPKKKSIKDLQGEGANIDKQITEMRACVGAESLSESIKAGVQEVLEFKIQQKAKILKEIEQRQSKNKSKGKKAKKVKEDESEESDGKADSGSDNGASQPAIESKPAASDKVSNAIEVRWEESMDDDEKAIPFAHRRFLKIVPGVLPQCSYISRDLALHILKNRTGHDVCVFHTLKSSGYKDVRDGAGNGKYVVMGVPFQKGPVNADRNPNTLYCGCNIDEALLDFMFYKVATAQSHNPGIVGEENLTRGDPLHSRHRTFLSQAFVKTTGIHVNDLYVGGNGDKFGGNEHMLQLLARVLESVNEGALDGNRMRLVEATPKPTADE